MEHPHAWVLRAIADGEPISDFECVNRSWKGEEEWEPATEYSGWVFYPDGWQVRRKQKTIKVNGFDVPEPVSKAAYPNELSTVFWPYLTYESLWDSAMPSNTEAKLAVQRGIAHLAKENAIAHAKAMLGIDPNT
jgi:hypothetical protein